MKRPALFVSERAVASPRCRLICFPYAGGNAAIFRGWQDALGDQVEVLAVELPGRGRRFAEAPIGDAVALVSEMVAPLRAVSDLPCIFYGHSNGALLAYELARQLRQCGARLPQRLILAAKRPPNFSTPTPTLGLSDSAFIERLREMGGTPEEVLGNADIMRMLLPMLRADFALSETYQVVDSPPLDCALSLFSGDADQNVPLAQFEQWRRYVRGLVEVRRFNGGHFFIHACRSEVLAAVVDLLSQQQCLPDGRAYG